MYRDRSNERVGEENRSDKMRELLKKLLYVHTRSDHSVKDALVAHKVSLRIFLFALVAQVAHDVQFNYADAFKGAVCV